MDCFLVLLNSLPRYIFFALTSLKRNGIPSNHQTKELLKSLEDDVFIEVFLEGDLNPGFRRFQKSVRETLEEFRIYSHNKVKFIFTNPAQAQGQKARNEFMTDLAAKEFPP